MTFIEKLFSRHGRDLQTYFRRRVRAVSDVDDLTQEVYLRMLRVSEAQVVHNPEAYLYTVASHLVQEHALGQRRQAASAGHDPLHDPAASALLMEFSQLDQEADRELRVRRLREVLEQLPPSCRAAVTLTYRYEMPQEQIAQRLGVSVSMVKKHLKHALAHCRKRMARWR